MQRPYRVVRVLVAGTLFGLVLSFGYVALAQTVRGESMPLVTALQTAALAADVQVVVAGVPVGDVFMPVVADDWWAVFDGLAAAFGLYVCELGPSTLLVTDSPHAAALCGGSDEELQSQEPARFDPPAPVGGLVPTAPPEAAVEPEPEPEPGAVVYRLRVLQLDEARAQELGLDWGSGVLDVAGRLVVAGYQAFNGVWPSASLLDMVRFLESEGVAMRLDDVELRTRGGQTVRFQRGGTINVNLVGGGDAMISQRYDYGLTLDLTGTLGDEEVALQYVFTDSAPGNVSDPRNVQLASTSASGLLDVPCGYSTVLAGIGSRRESIAGEGLPVLASAPGVGYGFGASIVNSSRVSYVVTVDVGCSA